MPDIAPREEENAVRIAIARVLRAHGDAMTRGDAVGAAAMFAHDTRWMPAGMPDVRGRDEAVRVISAFLGSVGPPRRVHHTTEDLYIVGDFAVEVGSVTATFGASADALTEAQHRYMQLWKRNGNGQWEVICNLLNSADPAPTVSSMRLSDHC